MPSSGFQFRFQKILDLRDRQHRMAELELAVATRRIEEQKARAESLCAAKKKVQQQQRDAVRDQDFHLRASCAQYLRHLKDLIQTARARVVEMTAEYERVLERYQEISRARKALENYRDSQELEFLREMERLDDKVAEAHTTNVHSTSGWRSG